MRTELTSQSSAVFPAIRAASRACAREGFRPHHLSSRRCSTTLILDALVAGRDEVELKLLAGLLIHFDRERMLH